MPDTTCQHLSPVGDWCRLQNNFKCPAQKGRIGCPMPNVVNLEERISERLERQETTMIAQHQAFAHLSLPFPASEIDWKIEAISKDRRRALVRPVLPARAVIDRLDAVLGASGWSDGFETHPSGQAKCKLSVLGVSKEDVSERATNWKDALNESLVRAASKFGIGRTLERINAVWVDYDEDTARILEQPMLPDWAISSEPVSVLRSLEPRKFVPLQTPVSAESVQTDSNISKMPAPNPDKLLAELIRSVRELPGGENALKRIIHRQNWQRISNEDKRKLYSELRRTHRELSDRVPQSA
jgi:hypothetical protein